MNTVNSILDPFAREFRRIQGGPSLAMDKTEEYKLTRRAQELKCLSL